MSKTSKFIGYVLSKMRIFILNLLYLYSFLKQLLIKDLFQTVVTRNLFLRAIIIIMSFSLFSAAKVHAGIQDVHNIIDICTSSERIMKDYALIGMKIVHHDPEKDMRSTIAHLKKEMEALEKHKLSKSLTNEEKKLHQIWKDIEMQLSLPLTKKRAAPLYRHIEVFRQSCETLAEHLAKDTHIQAEHFVVLIEKLNLLTQKLGALYILNTWGALDKEYNKEVHHILKEYMVTYNEILNADEKLVPKKIKNQLNILKKHFMLFEVMTEITSTVFVPRLVSKRIDMIDDETEKILRAEEKETE